MIPLIIAGYMATGVIPAIVFEGRLIRRYGHTPDAWTTFRLILAFLFGPVVAVVVAIVMEGME